MINSGIGLKLLNPRAPSLEETLSLTRITGLGHFLRVFTKCCFVVCCSSRYLIVEG